LWDCPLIKATKGGEETGELKNLFKKPSEYHDILLNSVIKESEY
jgi:hypothetical protein